MAQFNALHGGELKSVILAKIAEAMEDSGEFRENITFPWIKYTFELKMTSYPKFAADSEPVVVSEGAGESIDPEFVLPLEPPVEAVVSVEPEIIDTPDQARVDAELPIPTPVPVVGVGVVDKPVVQAKPSKGKGK